MKAIAILIVIIDFILFIGNRTGAFVTFPYAGFACMFIGSLFLGAGKKGAGMERIIFLSAFVLTEKSDLNMLKYVKERMWQINKSSAKKEVLENINGLYG